MTVGSANNKNQYAGDGVQTAFPTTFLFFEDSHLTVIKTVIATGVDTVQTLTTDYTVTGAGNPAGGTVTFLAAPAATERVTIKRVVPLTQGSDYINASNFDQEILERDLDENVMMMQSVQEQIDRAITLPPSSTLGSQDLPKPEANQLLGWNTAADGLENKAQTAGTVTIPTNAADKKKVLRLDAAGTAVEVGPKMDFDPTTGDAGKVLQVNSAEDAVEVGLKMDFDPVAGDAGKVIQVNSAEDGLAIGSIILGPALLADAAKTFVVGDMDRVFLITPTATRILTLPTTSVTAGQIIEIHNLAAAQKITIEASGGTDIATFQDGMMRLVVIQATPTTAAHWRILEVSGGASPMFKAKISSSQLITTANPVKVQFNQEFIDNNGNYDPTTNFRFTPTVPGTYEFIIQIPITNINLTDQDQHIELRENGNVVVNRDASVPATSGTSKNALLITYRSPNGSTDFYEAFVNSLVDINYDVSGDSEFFGRRIGN